MNNNKKYIRRINFESVRLTVLRRWRCIILLFSLLTSISFLISFFAVPQTFYSSVSITKNSEFANQHFETLKQSLYSSAKKTASELAGKSIVHLNGSFITEEEIAKGLKFDALPSNTRTVTYYFYSNDRSIVKDTLFLLSNNSIDYLKSLSGTVAWDGVYLSTDPTPPTRNNINTKVFLYACAAAIIVSFVVPFSYEILSDTVYEARDVMKMGYSAVEIRASSKIKKSH